MKKSKKKLKGLSAAGLTIYDIVPDMDQVNQNVLTLKEAAKLLNTSANYLNVMRYTDKGPQFYQFESNRAVFYFRHDLEDYKKARKWTRIKKVHNGPKKCQKKSGRKS